MISIDQSISQWHLHWIFYSFFFFFLKQNDNFPIITWFIHSFECKKMNQIKQKQMRMTTIVDQCAKSNGKWIFFAEKTTENIPSCCSFGNIVCVYSGNFLNLPSLFFLSLISFSHIMFTWKLFIWLSQNQSIFFVWKKNDRKQQHWHIAW